MTFGDWEQIWRRWDARNRAGHAIVADVADGPTLELWAMAEWRQNWATELRRQALLDWVLKRAELS